MTVQTLIDRDIFTRICIPSNTDRSISVPFCCDLLSIAMSRAPQDCAWVTVMPNLTTLAVAALTDCACIILAEGTAFDDVCRQRAIQEDIPVSSTTMPVFDAALKVWQQLGES